MQSANAIDSFPMKQALSINVDNNIVWVISVSIHFTFANCIKSIFRVQKAPPTQPPHLHL